MKKLYKIIIAFLIMFCIGLFISYKVITNNLKEDTSHTISSTVNVTILENTSKVVFETF